jgi:hypothetical protein
MIDPNLGPLERALRLLLAACIVVWLALRAQHDGWSAVAGVAALALGFNALYARCYLWTLLGLNTCPRRREGRNGVRTDA